jgi:ectoine hydroxylase-related dioxygenase (phytanoyl-CoA dioxygenase family)
MARRDRYVANATSRSGRHGDLVETMREDSMIRRLGKNLGVLDAAGAPAAAVQLERDGWAVLRSVFDAEQLRAIVAEVSEAFAAAPGTLDARDEAEHRYAMLERSAASQAAVGHPGLLAAIEPLLGDDCHVIANTAWRNPPSFAGGAWHCDAGPHVPRREGIEWDDRIPYPVFAVGAHIFLRDCAAADGPTAVVPGSHRSGRLPPRDRLRDAELTYDGRAPVVLEGRAGDVALFASDVWHRGTPSVNGSGRFFLQVHYGRRDLAQRLHPPSRTNQVGADATARATTPRARTLIGLHEPYFYDG